MARLESKINFIKTASLSDVLSHEQSPYGKRTVVTNCDIDGVIACRCKKNNPGEGLNRILSLRRITENSESMTIDSCRFISVRSESKDIFPPPFMNENFNDRLKKVLGEDKTDIKNGINKLLTCFGVDDGFYRTNLESLKNGLTVSIIGNTLMDTIRVRILTNKAEKESLDTKNIYYFKNPGTLI